MRKLYNSIKDINPKTRNWKVKVVVAEKTMTRTSQKSLTKYMRLILADSQVN